MAFIKSIDVIYKEMERQQIKAWQIFDQNKTDIIAESSEEDNLTVADSITDLKDITDTLEGIVYIIIRKDGAAAKRKATSLDTTAVNDKYRGIYKFQVRLGESSNQTTSNNSNSFGGGNNGLINMVMQSMQANFELQLNHLKEKQEQEKAYEERMRKLEEKLSGQKTDNPISDEMATKAILLLDKFLSK
jgi:hypothetical protein